MLYVSINACYDSVSNSYAWLILETHMLHVSVNACYDSASNSYAWDQF